MRANRIDDCNERCPDQGILPGGSENDDGVVQGDAASNTDTTPLLDNARTVESADAIHFTGDLFVVRGMVYVAVILAFDGVSLPASGMEKRASVPSSRDTTAMELPGACERESTTAIPVISSNGVSGSGRVEIWRGSAIVASPRASLRKSCT